MISAKNIHKDGAVARVVLVTFILCMCLLTNDVTFDKESRMKVGARLIFILDVHS